MKIFQKKKPGVLMTYVAAMLVLTIVAKIADSYMLPEVIVGSFQQMSLQYPVTVSGVIEADGIQPIYGTEELRVGYVAVEEGDLVEPGDMLFTYDLDYLEQKINDYEKTVQKLGIQIEAAESNQERLEAQRELNISRANEDYDAAVLSIKVTEEETYQDMIEAGKKLEEHRNNPPRMQQTTVSGSDAGAEQDFAVRMEAWEQQTEALEQSYLQTQRAYNNAVITGDERERNALRQIEDAKLVSEDDSSIKLQQIEWQEVKEKLEALRQIKEAGGNVYSEINGKVYQVNVRIGGIIGTDVAVFLEDFNQPFQFEGIADAQTAAYLGAGDICSIRFTEQNLFLENQVIDKVSEIRADRIGETGISETDIENKMYQIRVRIESEQVKQSGRAEMELTTESKIYQNCIPVTALYGGENDYYILLVKEEATTLGMQSVAVKVPVKVLERNESYAAVEGSIEQNGKVILQASKTIGDGERVKVVTE